MDHPKPLQNVRVLAIESYGAGPWATMQLADLGADIIKIEPPGTGDISRHVPPGAKDGDSLFFQCLNRNKRSISLDLRAPGGMDALHRLLPAVDILFANPKGSMPEKLKLTYEDLKIYNPRLVCCFLTGFGRTGPRCDHPGYDWLAQALSGILWLGGEPDGPPARSGVSVIDFATGQQAALLMVAALQRTRETGVGCTVDTSLLELAVSYCNYLNTWYLTLGFEPVKLPLGAHQTIVPSQLFAAADAWLMVMAQQDKFYRRLVKEMGLPELADDPRFRTMKDRFAHREELLEILAKRFKTRTAAEWISCLEGKVPVAPVNSIPEALGEPQLEALGTIISYPHPTLGTIRQSGPPFHFSDYTPSFSPASALGSDTEAVLSELGGFTAEEIDALRKSRTV